MLCNFIGVETAPNLWTFSGTVTGGLGGAAGLSVMFAGAPISIQGQMATVQADGSFALTVQFLGTPADQGVVTAKIFADWWGQASNIVNCFVV